MIIPVQLPAQVPPPTSSLPPVLASIGVNEIVIIELQGSIETEGDYSGEAIASLNMSIPASSSYSLMDRTDEFTQAKPTIRLGHHLLEGKIVSLSKPLAILKTVPNPQSDGSSPIAFDITAIIRKKIVFSKRPSPIVTHVDDIQKEPAKRIKSS